MPPETHTEFIVVCWKSQGISSGIMELGKIRCSFGSRIALRGLEIASVNSNPKDFRKWGRLSAVKRVFHASRIAPSSPGPRKCHRCAVESPRDHTSTGHLRTAGKLGRLAGQPDSRSYSSPGYRRVFVLGIADRGKGPQGYRNNHSRRGHVRSCIGTGIVYRRPDWVGHGKGLVRGVSQTGSERFAARGNGLAGVGRGRIPSGVRGRAS